jgi:hypothetical protein
MQQQPEEKKEMKGFAGLNSLVSDLSDFVLTSDSMISSKPTEELKSQSAANEFQQNSSQASTRTQSENKPVSRLSGSSGGKYFIGFAVAFFLFWLTENWDKKISPLITPSTTTSTQSSSLPSIASTSTALPKKPVSTMPALSHHAQEDTPPVAPDEWEIVGDYEVLPREQVEITPMGQERVLDLDKTVDEIFYKRHPELSGRKLTKHETGLIQEWLQLHHSLEAELYGLDNGVLNKTPDVPLVTGYIKGEPFLHSSGLSSFTVDNTGTDSDAKVKLFRTNSKIASRTFWLKAGERFTANKLDVGTYIMQYKDSRTGKIYEAERFTLSETPINNGIQYSQVTVTLYKVLDGNLEMREVSPENF